MKIKALRGRGRYEVIGDRGIPYTVHFFSGRKLGVDFDGHAAECTCPHFQERLKWLDARNEALGHVMNCKHIEFARFARFAPAQPFLPLTSVMGIRIPDKYKTVSYEVIAAYSEETRN